MKMDNNEIETIKKKAWANLDIARTTCKSMHRMQYFLFGY